MILTCSSYFSLSFFMINSFYVMSRIYLSSISFSFSIYLLSLSIYKLSLNSTSIFYYSCVFNARACSSSFISISLCVYIVLSNCLTFISINSLFDSYVFCLFCESCYYSFSIFRYRWRILSSFILISSPCLSLKSL